MSTSAFGRIALGLPSLIRIRYGLITRTERMSLAFARCCEGTAGSSTRRMLSGTSAAVNARPVQYFTSLRSVKNQVFKSFDARHFVARSGTTSMLRLYLARPLYSSVCNGTWPAKLIVFGSSWLIPAPAMPYFSVPLDEVHPVAAE